MKELDFEYDSKVINLGRNAIGIVRERMWAGESGLSCWHYLTAALLSKCFVLTKHQLSGRS